MAMRKLAITVFAGLLFGIGRAYCQFTGSGSTGVDGALNLTIPGDVAFESALINASHNSADRSVYHFTSIYVAAGVTVRLSAGFARSPVVWLAQGPVQIDGTIDLSGEDGGTASAQFPSVAGAGGHAGGSRGRSGYGPGAGDLGGKFTGNRFLVPLVGGSGGAGGKGCGGGAGGGALMIASSSSIAIGGAILANGGNGNESCGSSGGSGGAVRLIAPTIDGSGLLSARGGQPSGGDGRLRIEAHVNNFAGGLNDTPTSTGKPFGLFIPPHPPASVRVISVAGVPIAGYLGELAQRPKVQLNSLNQTSSSVSIEIECRFIPPGTTIDLEFFSENGTVQLATTTALIGNLNRSTATAKVDASHGASLGFLNARWKLPDER